MPYRHCYYRDMKLLICLLVAIAVAIPSTVFSQSSDVRWGAAARFHSGHKDLKDVPFDGDWSYGLLYEYREPQAYFQVGVSYAPSISFKDEFDGKTGDIDSIWTPEFNLVFTQGPWGGGVGILKHLVRREEGGEWSPVFWQFLLALNLGNRAKTGLDVTACYEFASWSDVRDVSMRDLDVRIGLTRAF